MSASIGPLVYDGQYLPEDYIDGCARYCEAQELIKNTYKEQQYWLSVYSRAQQFGLRGFSTQEVISNLQNVTNKLENYQKMLLPMATNQISNVEDKGNKEVSKELKF